MLSRSTVYDVQTANNGFILRVITTFHKENKEHLDIYRIEPGFTIRVWTWLNNQWDFDAPIDLEHLEEIQEKVKHLYNIDMVD